MNSIIWDVRGASKSGLVAQIKTFVSSFKVNLLVILEPRSNGSKASAVANKIGLCCMPFEHMVGFSRSIWILWDETSVQVHILHSFKQDATIMIVLGTKKWFLSVVYASLNLASRRRL